jgi:transposase-like protein
MKKSKPKTKESPPKKRKKPKWGWTPSQADIDLARQYALAGMTYAEMATLFGVSVDTLRARRNEFSEFSAAIGASNVKGVLDVKNFFYTTVMNPQEKTENRINAGKIFLQSRQALTDRVEHSGEIRNEVELNLSGDVWGALANYANRKKRTNREEGGGE